MSLGLLRKEHGYAVIEMAVILPAFVLLLFGMFQFAVGLTGYLGSGYAVRTAARYGALHSSTSVDPATTASLQAMVLAGPFVPNGTSTTVTISYVTFQGTSSGNYIGNVLSVQIGYPLVIKVPGFTKTITIASTAYRMVQH